MSSCDQDQCIEISGHEADQGPVLSASGTTPSTQPALGVSLLTGGSDRPYVFGLTTSLMSKGVTIDLIGSDELDFVEFRNRSGLNFLNLRSSLQADVNPLGKVFRVLRYYVRLIRYAMTANPTIFHVLWNNK